MGGGGGGSVTILAVGCVGERASDHPAPLPFFLVAGGVLSPFFSRTFVHFSNFSKVCIFLHICLNICRTFFSQSFSGEVFFLQLLHFFCNISIFSPFVAGFCNFFFCLKNDVLLCLHVISLSGARLLSDFAPLLSDFAHLFPLFKKCTLFCVFFSPHFFQGWASTFLPVLVKISHWHRPRRRNFSLRGSLLSVSPSKIT